MTHPSQIRAIILEIESDSEPVELARPGFEYAAAYGTTRRSEKFQQAPRSASFPDQRTTSVNQSPALTIGDVNNVIIS